jgi:hypothetical protein
MAVCDFYALDDDLRQVFQYLFAETDIVAYELSSRPERSPAQFRSLAEIEHVYPLGSYRAGHIQLWSPSSSAQPTIRRVKIEQPASTYRYTVEGVGLMQLYLDGRKDGIVYHTHFGHWNEAGARQRSVHSADDCDWPALIRLSRKIQNHVRRKLAAASLYSPSPTSSAASSGSRRWFVVV